MVTFRKWWRENVLFVSRMMSNQKMYGFGFSIQPKGSHPFHFWINHGCGSWALMSPYRNGNEKSRWPTLGTFHIYWRGK